MACRTAASLVGNRVTSNGMKMPMPPMGTARSLNELLCS
jgi:hypothetical protein